MNQAAWEGSDLRQLHRQTLRVAARIHAPPVGLTRTRLTCPSTCSRNSGSWSAKQPPWRIVHALKVWGAVNMRYDAPSTLPLELAVVEICEESAAPAPAG